MIVAFKRLLEKHRDIDHVQADEVSLSWHRVGHGPSGPTSLFLCFIVLLPPAFESSGSIKTPIEDCPSFPSCSSKVVESNSK